MSYLVSSFVLPKRQWDIEVSISRIYEDIAVCLSEYTFVAAQSHRTAIQNQDGEKYYWMPNKELYTSWKYKCWETQRHLK